MRWRSLTEDARLLATTSAYSIERLDDAGEVYAFRKLEALLIERLFLAFLPNGHQRHQHRLLISVNEMSAQSREAGN